MRIFGSLTLRMKDKIEKIKSEYVGTFRRWYSKFRSF